MLDKLLSPIFKHWKISLAVLLLMGSAIIAFTLVIPKIKEHNELLKAVQSLEYDAIESAGIKYYPTTIPLMWVPASLPPIGFQIAYWVIDGKTDYSKEYFAETFVDDYNKNYLYMDGLVFKKQEKQESVGLISEKSYFSDFYVKDNMVYIECYLKILNTFDNKKSIQFRAIMNEDFYNGLLKQKELHVLDENHQEIYFEIDAHSEKMFEVIFVGEYGGNNEKLDRLLPNIDLKILD